MPRGRPIVTPLTLTPEQVASLTQIANSRTAEHRQVQRARILLGAASGKPQRELAEEAKLSVSAVARFLRKALQIGPMMAFWRISSAADARQRSVMMRVLGYVLWPAHRRRICRMDRRKRFGQWKLLRSTYASMRRNTTLGTLLEKPPSLRSGQFSKKE